MKKKADKKPESISALAKAKGMKPSLVHGRIRRGWTLEEALLTPPRKIAKPKKAEPKLSKEEAEIVNDKLKQEIQSTQSHDEAMGWLIFIVVCAAIVGAFIFISQ